MAIKLPLSREQNNLRAELPEAYLKLLDVEIAAQSGNVRLPFYCYHDEQARKEKNPLPAKQGTEMVPFSEFAPIFQGEHDALMEADPDSDCEEILRIALFKAGYAVLKARGFTGEDC